MLPDALHLWWLGNPRQPVYVGELHTVRALRGVSLRYGPSWLELGFPLSEDLPLHAGEHLPTEKDTAAGAVDDARPDRWGERVIRLIDQPPRLGLLDFLYWAGDERFGALSVSVSADCYTPRPQSALPQLQDLPTLHQLVNAVLNKEAVPPALHRLIAPGGTLGGAKPKALIQIDSADWIVKFPEPGDLFNSALVEHATLSLAAKVGIRVCTTRPVPLPNGQHALAVKRFDREGGRRVHCLSAHVVLRAAGEAMGYPELAQWLRRCAPAATHRAQMAELFRRMVFNILLDNTDDHEKNHAVWMNDQGRYELTPAFDVLPTAQGLHYQQMRVGRDQADSTLENAISEHAQFGLSLSDARTVVAELTRVTKLWKECFAQCGVAAEDIDLLGRHVKAERYADR
jgi:serine/threonine-protein kinase HipA